MYIMQYCLKMINFLEIDNLVLKFAWKWERSKRTEAVLKKNTARGHFLSCIINVQNLRQCDTDTKREKLTKETE